MRSLGDNPTPRHELTTAMQYLHRLLRGPSFGSVPPTCQVQVLFVLHQLNNMLHRLCEPPSIPLSFSLDHTPRRDNNYLRQETLGVPCLVPSFTARTTRVSNPVCPLAAPQRRQAWRPFRLRRSSRYLRISPLHLEFRLPLPPSSNAVSQAVPRLSRGISPMTYAATYVLFMPSDSEQRLHHSYYRSCWHEFSWCFL